MMKFVHYSNPILSSILTLYHTISTFNYPRERNQHFFPFPTMFSTLTTTNSKILVIFILSSANASNLDQSETLSFGKELMGRGAVLDLKKERTNKKELLVYFNFLLFLDYSYIISLLAVIGMSGLPMYSALLLHTRCQ